MPTASAASATTATPTAPTAGGLLPFSLMPLLDSESRPPLAAAASKVVRRSSRR